MQFISTRGRASPCSFCDLLTRGLAEDGGLYMPLSWPALSAQDLDRLKKLPYPNMVAEILQLFAQPEDYSLIDDSCHKAFKYFNGYETPKLVALSKKTRVGWQAARAPKETRVGWQAARAPKEIWSLELFNGPTAAFKDFAMFPLASLIDGWLGREQKQAMVVCATSGDTGAAAAAAFAHQKSVSAFILFPKGRISPVQQGQITAINASNIKALAVEGDFDDCQNMVKQMMSEKTQFGITGASIIGVNSINFVRIAAQTAYYVYACLQIGKKVDFIVPSGNFGNAFAGYIARQLGMPIRKIVIASNQNDVLPRLFVNGKMHRSSTIASLSPSMDIQIASNFERYLWVASNRDSDFVNKAQQQLTSTGEYQLPAQVFQQLKKDFSAFACSEQETVQEIQNIEKDYGKEICPHSATGFFVARKFIPSDDVPAVVIETASAAKFPKAAKLALGRNPTPHHSLNPHGEEKFQTIRADYRELAEIIAEQS